MTLYEDLGVSKDADKATIKKAYRRRAQKEHPDRGGDAEKFHQITRAYNVLYDDARRAHYDQTGQDGVEDRQSVLMTRLAQLFCQIIEQGDVDHVDIIESMKASIVQGQNKNRAQIKTIEQKIAKYEKVKKRLSKNGGGDNLFAQMVDGQIAANKRGVEMGNAEIERQEEMLAILRGYKYTVDYNDPKTQTDMLRQYWNIAAAEVFPGARR